MTFTEIVTEVADRLGLSSSSAITRLGRLVNAKYRKVTSSIGMKVARQVTDVVASTTLGSQTVTFTGIEKIDRVFVGTTGKQLDEITFDEIRTMTTLGTGTPAKYAIERMGAGSVKLRLDVLAGSVMTLKADGLETAATLSGTQVPAFDADFHDVLVEGVIADEYLKEEKTPLYKEAKATYDMRLSELRMFIAKSGGLIRRAGQTREVVVSGGGGATPSTLVLTEFSVVTYGATGNGTTDDTVAVQKALDAAAVSGGTVYFPRGTYVLSAELDITASNVRLRGDGRNLSVLQWTDAATKGLVIAGSSTTNATATLSGNASIGDQTVGVVSATGLVDGGFAYLEDSTSHAGSFLTRMRGIAGTTVTLESAMPVALLTSGSAKLYNYVDLLHGIDIRDLTFRCVAGASTANKLTLLELRRLVNARVENCEFDGSVGPLVTVVANLDGGVSRCRFTNGQSVAAAACEIQTSTGFSISDCDSEFVTFGFTPSRSPFTRIENCRVVGRGAFGAAQLGRGVRFGDHSNFSVVTGCTISDTALFGIYAQDSAYCNIENNVLSNIGVAAGEHGIAIGGFTDDSVHCIISGNTVRNAKGAGIFVQSVTAGANLYCVITGNRVSGSVQRAVYIGASRCTITGNVLTADGVTNFQILNIANSGGNCIVAGNTFAKETATNLAAVQTDAGAGSNIISPNQLNGLSNSLHATDSTYVTAATLATTVTSLTHVAPIGTTVAVGTNADLLEKTLATFTIPANVLTITNITGFNLWGTGTLATAGGTIRVKVNGVTVATGPFGLIPANGGYTLSMWGMRGGVAALDGGVSILFGSSGAGAVLASSGFSATADFTTPTVITITGQNDTTSTADRVKFSRGFLTFAGVPTTAFA